MQAPTATVSKLRSKKASKRATVKPAAAEQIELVEYKMAGSVIAAKTAYGM